MRFTHSVFPGRLQFAHNGHIALAQYGLQTSEKLLMALGSVKRASTIENPLSFEKRVDMISSVFSKEERKRIEFMPIRDYYYNDNRWLCEVQQQTGQFINDGDPVQLLAVYKDGRSTWNNAFPQWEKCNAPLGKYEGNVISGTDIRTEMFEGRDGWEKFVNLSIAKWVKQNFLGTPEFDYLVEEYNHYKQYKSEFSMLRYPPTFNTADAVVFKSGHVLLVKRRTAPGKGCWALPGGFINQNETRRAAALRELKEETGIKVDKIILDKAITAKEEFDFPYRSLRGRTITMAYKIDLGHGPLPEVKGGDDASKAFWLPYIEVYANSHKFFEDHFDILDYFIANGSKEKFL